MIEYYNETKIPRPFNSPTSEEIYDWLKNHQINSEINTDIIRCWLSHAIPTPDTINQIRNFIGQAKCLEIGAGRGLWSFLIGDHLVVTDKFPPDWSYLPVIAMDCQIAISRYSDCQVLIIIWPPCDDTMAEAVRYFVGDKIIYVGEYRGGCTGSDQLFNQFELKFDLKQQIQIPTLYQHSDQVYLWQRKQDKL